MFGLEFCCCQSRGQSPGIPNFQAVSEQHHLHAGITRVISMHNSIYDGFVYGGDRKFILHAIVFFGMVAYSGINMRHYESDGLVAHFKNSAAKNLIIGSWLLHIHAVELSALHL